MKDVFSLPTQVSFPKFEEELRAAVPDLPRLEAQVAQYMMLNIGNLSFETGASLARKVGVSEVTVSRLLRRLGHEGMRGLRKELRNELLNREPLEGDDSGTLEAPNRIARNLELEYEALREVFQQCASSTWGRLVRAVVDADCVYVTGFQAVRGIAEDCARRLGITRDNVQFLAAHDGMLTEWLGLEDDQATRTSQCLILIDVVPYAREAKVLARLCKESNRSLIVITDEMCHWAKNYTDLVVHASTRTGLILESTVAITAALNLMVNSVADQNSATLTARLDRWKADTRALKLF
jgi:DNA-binding MurR/RpiR family transcriptional regulator